MARCRRGYPATRKPRSSTRSRLAVAAASPSDQTYAEQLKAGAILEKLCATQPDHPGLAHYIIHSYDSRRWPTRARRGAALRGDRARCAARAATCRRIPSRASATGRSRSTPTSPRAAARDGRRHRRRAARHGLPDLRLPADGAGRAGARRWSMRCPRSRRGSIRMRRRPPRRSRPAYFAMAAIPARYALERGAWAEAAQLDAAPTPFPYTEALTYSRARSAPRTPADAPLITAVDRGAAAHHRARSRRSTKPTGPSRPTSSGARRSRGWRSPKGATTTSIAAMREAARMRGRHREGGGDARPARAGARTARRDAAAAEPAGRRADRVRGDAQEGAEPVPRRLRCGKVGRARGQPGEGADLLRPAGEDLRARRFTAASRARSKPARF